VDTHEEAEEDLSDSKHCNPDIDTPSSPDPVEEMLRLSDANRAQPQALGPVDQRAAPLAPEVFGTASPPGTTNNSNINDISSSNTVEGSCPSTATPRPSSSPGTTTAGDPAPTDNLRSREFLVFTKSRPLTEAEQETLRTLQSDPPGTKLRVFGVTLDLWTDLIAPLIPGNRITNLPIDSRLALLQQHSIAIGNVSCLKLSTYMWSFFHTNADKPFRDREPIASRLQHYLARFQLDAAAITRVLIPINTDGTHWKALALDMENGDIQDMDSGPDQYEHSSRSYKLYRRFAIIELYATLRPQVIAGVRVQRMVTAPLHTNGPDSGMFMTAGIESMALRGTLDFTQQDMISLRRQMVLHLAGCRRAPRSNDSSSTDRRPPGSSTDDPSLTSTPSSGPSPSSAGSGSRPSSNSTDGASSILDVTETAQLEPILLRRAKTEIALCARKSAADMACSDLPKIMPFRAYVGRLHTILQPLHYREATVSQTVARVGSLIHNSAKWHIEFARTAMNTPDSLLRPLLSMAYGQSLREYLVHAEKRNHKMQLQATDARARREALGIAQVCRLWQPCKTDTERRLGVDIGINMVQFLTRNNYDGTDLPREADPSCPNTVLAQCRYIQNSRRLRLTTSGPDQEGSLGPSGTPRLSSTSDATAGSNSSPSGGGGHSSGEGGLSGGSDVDNTTTSQECSLQSEHDEGSNTTAHLRTNQGPPVLPVKEAKPTLPRSLSSRGDSADSNTSSSGPTIEHIEAADRAAEQARIRARFERGNQLYDSASSWPQRTNPPSEQLADLPQRNEDTLVLGSATTTELGDIHPDSDEGGLYIGRRRRERHHGIHMVRLQGAHGPVAQPPHKHRVLQGKLRKDRHLPALPMAQVNSRTSLRRNQRPRHDKLLLLQEPARGNCCLQRRVP
jgi:hypothetical protein